MDKGYDSNHHQPHKNMSPNTTQEHSCMHIHKEILDFLTNQKAGLKKLFLVHGEIDRQQALSEYLQENGFSQDIEIPKLGQSFDIN